MRWVERDSLAASGYLSFELVDEAKEFQDGELPQDDRPTATRGISQAES
jgi:hypothetical protein